MKGKEILVVSYDYFPDIGGIAVYSHEMSKALQKLGHKVTILTYYFSLSNKIILEYNEGIEIYRVPIIKIRKISDFCYQNRMVKLINKLQKSKKIDVIHWQTMHKDAKVMKKIKVTGVSIYTNHLSLFRVWFNQGKHNKLMKMIGNPDHIICPSKEIKKMSEQILGSDKCSVIPNGVVLKQDELDETSKIALKKEIGIDGNYPIIVTTSRMEPVKGMTYFVQSIPQILKKHPNIFICMIGDGSEEIQLKKWLENQKIDHSKVKFLGRKTNNEVKKIVELATIYVQPSLMEGCSISILEAMACSKAVVASEIGGNPDIIEHGKTGLLVQEKSSSAIFEALDYLLENPSISYQLGIQAKSKIIENFTWTTLAREIDDIYTNTIRKKRNEK